MMYQEPFENELIVDSFCGGGGASEGIRMATGRDPDVAINHDPEAVAMHQANHPDTRHYCQSIYKVDPADIVREYQRRIGLAWFSPDCTHHSKARGGKPKQKHIRDLAWVVVHWAERAVYKGQRIRQIYVENVEEFQDWGPLLEDGKPCPVQKGTEFKRWVTALKKLGYKVEWRELRACDFGAPTIRKRLFVIARCDGEPIIWPEPTHGPGKIPYRTAAECIDWSRPCPSIFLTKEEGKAVRAKRPLADATMRRVAHGVKRFVIDASEPFIINLTHQGSERNEPLSEPFKTITGANRGEKALVTPFLAGAGGPAYQGKPASIDKPFGTIMKENHRCAIVPYLTEHANASSQRLFPADSPLRTQCAQVKGGHFALVSPSLIQMGYGERDGQKPRILDLEKPLGTVVAGGKKHAIAAAFLAQHNTMPDGGVHAGRELSEPASTITATGSQQGLVASSLVKLRGTCNHGQPLSDPLATISAQGQHLCYSAAFLTKYYGNETDGVDISGPMHTVTAKDRFGLVGGEMQPAPLQEWQLDRARAVADLLRKYDLWDEREFVTIEYDGATWIIVDIGIRMLARRELFTAQGFRRNYIIDPVFEGKPMTKTASVRMCGNSVSPHPAAAIISVNQTDPYEFMEAAE